MRVTFAAMAEVATDLEDLSPRAEARAPARQAAHPPGLTARARAALYVSAAVFTVVGLGQALAALWGAAAVALVMGAAAVLLHTGGMEPRTFETCVIAAGAIDVLVLCACLAAVVAARRRTPVRRTHAIEIASLAMVAGLLFVRAFGWEPSLFFPYPLATILVLASACFFGMLIVAGSAQLAVMAWRRVRRWGLGSAYRAGFLTASLMLSSVVGYAALTRHWYRAPVAEVRARLEHYGIDEDPTLASVELSGLCAAADALDPDVARSGRAPACRAAGVAADAADAADAACYTALMEVAVPNAKRTLRTTWREYDIDDAVMSAVLATCTRRPPADDPSAYFYRVAQNELRRHARMQRREVSCVPADEVPTACASGELPEVREAKLESLWQYALCEVGDRAAEVIRLRLVNEASFAVIGAQLGMTETRAKDTYHNAVKKLRRLDLSGCADSL